MAERGRAPEGSARAASVLWVVPLLIPFLVLAALHWDWLPGATYGDHAQYLAHARAIVEGRPYGDIGYIYQPAEDWNFWVWNSDYDEDLGLGHLDASNFCQ